MDDSAVKLRNRVVAASLAWLGRVLDLYAFQVVNTFHGSSLLFANSLELNKSEPCIIRTGRCRKTRDAALQEASERPREYM